MPHPSARFSKAAPSEQLRNKSIAEAAAFDGFLTPSK